MSEQETKNSFLDKRSSRRTFIKNSGLTVGGVVLGGAFGSLLGNKNQQTTKTETQTQTANPNVALMFFTPEQYQVTQAASERIFPEDENGPGAMKLNAAIYIDHQLASPWGLNAKDYRLGPFYKPEPTQGGQTKMLRKDLFPAGLQALNDYSNKQYNKKFTELEAVEQNIVLSDFSDGKTSIYADVSSTEFFNLLRSLTIEGVYADPLYGGNKDMIGWKMRKYPGSQMSYTNIMQNEKFVVIEPVSLNSHMGH